MNVNPRQTGLALGLFLGSVHFVWALMVALGLAQPFMDFIFSLHFITPPYQIAPFDLGRALGLVVVTSLSGLVLGWAFGLSWNMVLKRK